MKESIESRAEKFLRGELDIKDLLSIEDGEIDYLLQLGYLFFKEGRYAESEKIFKGLMRIVPENSYPYIALGAIFLRREDFESAIKIFKKGLSMEPDNVTALLNLGEALLLKGDKKEAYQYLIKCKKLVGMENYPIYTRVRMLLLSFYGE